MQCPHFSGGHPFRPGAGRPAGQIGNTGLTYTITLDIFDHPLVAGWGVTIFAFLSSDLLVCKKVLSARRFS